MTIFELDQLGARNIEQEAMASGVNINDITPEFSEGIGTGIGQGIMRGGARVGQFIGMAAAAPAVLFDKATGTQSADAVFRTVDDYVNSAVDYWTPDANTVGTAGRILGGLSEIALPLAAGGGNPLLLIGSQEMGTATDLTRAGANPNAAVLTGLAQGLSTAIGFKLPFLGSNFLTKAATGAAGNLVTNIVTSAISQKLMSGSLGTPELATQYDPFDYEARLTDVLTGIAFGGLAHLSVPSVRDAAITATNAKHFQQDTAPGIPIDPKSAVAHQDAMQSAMDSLLKGEPVSVKVPEGQFLKRPEMELPPEVKAELAEFGQKPVETTTTAPPEPRIVGFETAKGSTYDIDESGATTRNKSAHPEHPGDEGIKPKSEQTFYVTREDAVKLAEIQTEGLKRSVNLVDEGRAGVRYEQGKDKGQFEGRTVVPIQRQPAVGMIPVETWKGGRETHFGNEITRLSTGTKGTVHADPIVAHAAEVTARVDHPIAIIDDAGHESTMSARELLAKADEAVKQAETDSKGFLAAANCLLQVGQ